MIIYRWCLASLLIFSWAFPAVFAIPLFVAYGKFPAIGLVWIFAQDPMRTVAEFVLTSAEHPSTKVKRRLAHISGQSNKHFLFPVFWCGTKIIQNHPRSSTIIQYHPRPSKFIQDHPNSSKIIQTHPRSSKLLQDHPNSSKILCSGVAGGEEWLEAVGIVRGLYCHHLSRSLRHFDILSCEQSHK